jgi:UDP-N-acetylglucosamine/UDP-N-acetylgalactosamine diphosphorylase
LAAELLDDDFHLRRDFRGVSRAVLFGVLFRDGHFPVYYLAALVCDAFSVPIMKDILLSKLSPLNQQHLLAQWDALDQADRARLAQQIQDIDWDDYARLRKLHAGSGDDAEATRRHWQESAARSVPPAAVRLGQQPGGFTRDQARGEGEAALRAGKVGMILVAGGLGTRLGFDLPKGMFPLGPVSNRPLFQILIDQLRAVSQRHGVRLPLYVMTSPATHEVTEKFLAVHNRFGLPAEDVILFQQGTMYAVDEKSFDVLLSAPGEIFTGPDGHGGMLGALVKHGVLKDARARGIEQFFYGQIDNPLLTVCDPELIGCHRLANSELTTQVVAKTDPAEKVGVVVEIDGRTQIIEYVDLPGDASRELLPDGSLKFWAGNIAVHVFDVAFLERVASQADALPFHTSRKKVPFVDRGGQVVQPSTPNAIRFERFIFDLLPHATKALVVEVDKAAAFAPVKNDDKSPTDSPTTARAAMIARDARLLRAAGVEVADGVPVEVNPLWASDADDARQKLKPGTKVSETRYFA